MLEAGRYRVVLLLTAYMQEDQHHFAQRRIT